jgi:two-component system sensor histidine kinase KdpD
VLRRHARGTATWLAGAAFCTLVLWLLRGSLDKAHLSLAYLLVVLGASARHGRTAGIVLAVACFFAFNFFLLPPLYTLKVADPRDWLVLAAFLATGMVAAELLHRAQREAAVAQERAAEIDRLAALGAETLSVARAGDAVQAIARVIASNLPLAGCDIAGRDPETGELSWMAAAGDSDPTAALRTLAAESARSNTIILVGDSSEAGLGPAPVGLVRCLEQQPPARSILIPLLVRDRCVGVLHLAGEGRVVLDAAQSRFAGALAHYAALAVERTRLATEAERVEGLRQADRVKDALLASVSHDLRTPLTAIKALASELRADGDDRAAVIEEETDRLNHLVTDLLDLSRMKAGGLRVNPEINAADDLVGAALRQVSGTPGGRAIVASIPGDELLIGRFDFTHTLRSLVNLLENALRYSPAEGSVALDLSADDDVLRFAVADRGPGVPPAERERIFEPFQRLRPRPGASGTGLGLAIARQLAEMQCGRIEVAERPGGGSVFSLIVPRVHWAAGPPDSP